MSKTDKEYVEGVIGQTCTDLEIRAFCAIWPNPDQPVRMGNPVSVEAVAVIPRIGTYWMHEDKRCVILSTSTYQEDATTPWNPTADPSWVTICTILYVTTEGEDAGEASTNVHFWKLTAITE